jgi:guanylate kinase
MKKKTNNSISWTKQNSSSLKGKVFVFTGPSGAGKTTIIESLLKENSSFGRIITCTTRAPRTGEKNGVDYNFVSRKKFEFFIKNDLLLEYAEVYGNYYGSLKSDAEKLIASGKTVLISVDVKGAITMMKKLKGSETIFIKTPSIKVLKDRLLSRGKDSIDVIEKRIALARKEIKIEKRFDYIVVNDKLDAALRKTKKIIENSQKSLVCS